MAKRNPTRPTLRWLVVLLIAAAVPLVAGIAWWLRPTGELGTTIGMEGRYEASIPGGRLHAVPYTHGDALAARIASAEETDDGFHYDIRYMAYGPGEHDIARYLIDDDGKQPAGLPELAVSVEPLLADDESGELFASPQAAIDLHSNYRLVMTMLWGVWGMLFIPLILLGRKRRRPAAQESPPPSVPERLRQLLTAAEQESLTAEQQADLEQLLMTYWAQRLGVNSTRLVETLEQLKQHPSAGPQLQSVETWLHSRQTPANGHVARQLLLELGWASDKLPRRAEA